MASDQLHSGQPALPGRRNEELPELQARLDQHGEDWRKRAETDESFRAVFVDSLDGILFTDPDGAILAANRAACDILGRSEQEICAPGRAQVVDTSDPRLPAALAERARTGFFRGELTFLRRDGTPFPVELSTRIFSNAGEEGRACIVFRDISERKRAAAAAATSHDLLVNLARLVPGVIYQYRLYPDGRSAFPYSSPGMDLIYEVTPEEVREDAAPVFGRLHPQDYDGVASAIAESARSLKTFYCEFRVVLPRQGLRWRWSQAQPERTADGGTLWHGIILDVTDRKLAEQAHRHSEARARAMLQAIPDMVFRMNREGVFLDYKADARDLHAQLDLVGKRNRDLTPPEFADMIDARIEAALSTGALQTFEYELPIPGRGVRAYEARMAVSGADEVTAVVRDITDRRQAEAETAALEVQLRQAQKMESVGRLAGGVAHDFNNMLGVILGHAELAMVQLGPTDLVREDLEEIRKAANRSSDLARQLLAFARRQTVTPKILDLNETVGSMVTMLQRLIGEDIHLEWSPRAGLWRVKVDPSQIDQLLANLCVNSRDAISGTGRVTIASDNVTFDTDYCALHSGFVPGDYVRLAVSDDGCGMSQDTQAHLFEPFFTTKSIGRGTGLGLATVYGIVRQNGGFINVYSEPGHGTTITTYFPRHLGAWESAVGEAAPAAVAMGDETILLVEDEPAMLSMATTVLEGLGYAVVAARSPVEALRLAAERAAEIRLVITDVVMPDMNGRDLANELLARHPHMKHLFMSGYTADVIARQGVLEAGVPFIQKPFSREALALKVRETLDAK